MSFAPYPGYKASGVEWLGQLPTHWEVAPLKRDLAFLTSGSRGWADNYSDSGNVFIRIANLTRDRLELDLSDVQLVSVPDSSESLRTKVRAGDILFSITAYLGSVAVVPHGFDDAYVSQHVALARLRRSSLASRWVGYVALSRVGRTWFDMQSYGGTKIQLSLDDVRDLAIPRPPAPEQAAIVAFLDCETAKIDALVAEQERLIELLKEKRQAVISHAVTKGLELEPHVPTKSSGVGWLGDIPAHWELKRLKYLGKSVIGLTYAPTDVVDQDGTLVLRSSNVQAGEIVFDDNVYVSTVIRDELVTRAGDILICSRNGSRALIGKNAVVDGRAAGLTFGAFMTVLRSAHWQYLTWVLKSPLFEYQSGSFLTSTINQLTVGVLNDFEVPFPPADERDRIAAFLRKRVAEIDALAASTMNAIDLLRERRTALISAAVTGQIDVRAVAAGRDAQGNAVGREPEATSVAESVTYSD